ncbi:uncharacterized protein CLAFUR5_09318 [Fulvia fulva]|uniref:FAD-binding PCMH-type domain-containing protein n=1 Tax=Passalora fulva TaxID=5499 RepID=A0A9Q8UT66_PASFU|nr:uncharacterized protein CLAFUR5_09318 [Fulvia fulva]UJO21579.1 hypothetical protein CLAFUR5_09318 [Fulvia fulva]
MVLTTVFRLVPLLSAILAPVLAAPSPNAVAACGVIERQYPAQYADNGLINSNISVGLVHTQQRQEYWSLANADNKPACMFFPKNAKDIAFAVQVLNNYTTVPWAVKGGGHNPNRGYSSSQDGVRIACEPNMKSTTLDANNLAHVGPGSRWTDVATALDPYNRAVVSGRLGHVGVASLSLGDGLSFLSTEYGLTADTIAGYVVITADGVIRNANKNENSDLFYALKGGGNQFAIVSEFILETFAIGQVWGGTKIFGKDQKDALLKATHNLVSDYYDPKAAVIVTFSTTLDTLVDIFVVFFFYNGPSPGKILDELNAIPALIDSTKGPRSYRDLINANSAFSLNGMRYLIRTGTFPRLPGADGLDIYNYTFDSWYDAAKKYQLTQLDNLIYSLAFQPIPHQLAAASKNAPNGVNLLGLDPAYGDKFFMEYDVSWLVAPTDKYAADSITQMTQPAQDYARSKYGNSPPTNYQSGDLSFTNFNPMFMNDAMYNQQPLQSYGQGTYQRLKQIQQQRDPKGLFSRTGGFKFI